MSGGDGQPETLAGVTVTLGGEHAMGETMETDETGGFMFTGLRAGTYTVTISNFPEDVSFETVSVEVEVDVGDVGSADFTGHYIRTSAVEGQVVIDGEGLAGVTVTLNGGPSDESYTMMTDADGMYRFEDLRPGDYTVSISDFDTRDYEFAATSQDVSVDLDETGTVSFTGVLLRTSGISGRVSVEGMGLDDIAVTLSGAADASTTTDAGGQYSFAGLAAGDYTVTIAVESAAYVFDSMSQDRTVGDDESAIVNFEGAHARTARVSGMLFLDELDKNDMMDAGEHPLAQAGIPVALVGPGVNDQRLSATDAAGAFSFSGLRAGSYQLVVPIDAATAAALAANDVAYGGPGTGYEVTLEVGDQASQAVPFDITHTTVNFSVSLRSGDETGDALSGASVTLYAANDASVGTGTTGEDGSVAIKVARARTSGNMVMAGVSADGYHVADGMTEVSWDPQMFATSGANANDIVNLNVSATVSGATVARGDHGGEALAGWAISVTSGGSAVDGAPTALGDDGTASFATTVGAGDLPASFTFAVAADQDDALDGGEMYEGSDGGYEHDGLSVAPGEADPIVVTFTTQTLKVYVHHEFDQVRGYTGNTGYQDVRKSGLVDLEVRQASGNDGRFTSPISSDDWDSRANSSDSKGVYTFAHLPADKDIVVRATARDGYKILDLVQLDAYRNMDENGVEGGAFGEMGGWGHTVALCPLEKIEPTGQDFGRCASFALVSLHDVSANVSKMTVGKSATGFKSPISTFASGIEVSLTPVEGKNLAGVGQSFTTTKSDDPTTPIDERRNHDFDPLAAGSYELGLPAGWRAMVGTAGAAGAFDPLAGDVALKVTPSTATLYGFVRNTDGFGLVGVKVTVNGQTETTDDLGRYIVTGIPNVRGKLFVNTERTGFPAAKPDSTSHTFDANTVKSHNITLSGANNTVAITGTVTESGTGAGIKGVEILVDGKPPLNAGTGQGSGKLVTGANGTYTAIVEIQPSNDPLVIVTPKKSNYHFIPASAPVPAIVGTTPSADFTGYPASEITGRVTMPGSDMPMKDIKVTAYSDADMTKAVDHMVTTETGTFSVFVPTLSGTVWLEARPLRLSKGEYGPTTYPTREEVEALVRADRYVWFDAPSYRANNSIAVIPGQPLNFGTFKGNSVEPRITKVTRVPIADFVEAPGGGQDVDLIVPARDTTPNNTTGAQNAVRYFDLVQGEPTDVIEVTWEYETRNAWTNGATDAEPGKRYAAQNVADALVADDATSNGRTDQGEIAGEPFLGTNGVVAGANKATPASTSTASDDATVSHTRKTTYFIPTAAAADYGEIKVRIGHNVTGISETSGADTLYNDFTFTDNNNVQQLIDDIGIAPTDSYQLAAVDGSVTELSANIKITHPSGGDIHTLTASWVGAGSPRLQHRIALLVRVNSGTTNERQEWIVFDIGSNDDNTNAPVQPHIGRATASTDRWGSNNWAKWSSAGVNLSASDLGGTWLDDGNGGPSYTVTNAELEAATQLRIDTRVKTVTIGGRSGWTLGPVVNITRN